MRKSTQRKQVRFNEHHAMMAEFILFLDKHWQLWRQHEGNGKYNDLRAAFAAGWKARRADRS